MRFGAVGPVARYNGYVIEILETSATARAV
jgi:hypothetical protein